MPFLELRYDDAGPAHWIGKLQVQNGASIELRMRQRDGMWRWVLGTYEWSHQPRDSAWFYYVDDDSRDRIHLLVNGTEVRWPK